MSLKILKFKTIDNQYVFDGKTGTVIAVDEVIFDCIEQLEKQSIEKVRENLTEKYEDAEKVEAALQFVNKYKKVGAFYENEYRENNRLEKGLTIRKEDIKMTLDAGYMHQLVLNVTENCNMRCKYCYLSEAYKYTRNRTNEMMSIEVAEKALDYYFGFMKEYSLFNPGKKCAITFYGGEALLNFKLIKHCIEYAREKSPIGVLFNITTNGALLKGEIADYLVQNDVAISISLDGARTDQDRNRVDASGNGTFDIVYNNIKELRKKYPQYYKINIASVYDPVTDFIENDQFFEENEKELAYVGMLSPVVEIGTDYYKKYTEEQIIDFRKRYLSMMDKYIDCKINNKKMSTYLQMLFELQFVNVLMTLRGKDKKVPFIPFTGSCIPGMKISVRTNGDFEICEKMNQTFPIGNIETGLDMEAVEKIIRDYNDKIGRYCVGCPINRSCGICYAQVCGEGTFEKPNCENIINSFSLNLSIIYTILEKNPHAFDQYYYRDEWILNA